MVLPSFVTAAERTLAAPMSADNGRRVELQQRIALFEPGFRGGQFGSRDP